MDGERGPSARKEPTVPDACGGNRTHQKSMKRPDAARGFAAATGCGLGTGRDLHDVEKNLLAQAVLALEELVLGVSAGDVAPDQLLAGRRHLEQLGILVFDGHVGGAAEQLPHDGAEVVGDPFADELLRRNGAKKPKNPAGFATRWKLLVDG